LSRRRKTGRLFASIAEVGRLFQMAGTAELEARLLYAVRVFEGHKIHFMYSVMIRCQSELINVMENFFQLLVQKRHSETCIG